LDSVSWQPVFGFWEVFWLPKLGLCNTTTAELLITIIASLTSLYFGATKVLICFLGSCSSFCEAYDWTLYQVGLKRTGNVEQNSTLLDGFVLVMEYILLLGTAKIKRF
jgi:hypothetical protein